MSTKSASPRTGAKDADALGEQLAMATSLNGAALKAMADNAQACLAGFQAVSREVSDFMTERLEYDSKFVESISCCSDATEFASLQQDWLRQTTEDYLAESRKLVHMSSQLMGDGWKTLLESARPDAGKGGRA